MRARQESSNSLPTDPMDRRLLSLTNQDDDDLIHTLVSTNDINLQIMEFLDITSLVRFGMSCRGPHDSLPLELSRRSKRLTENVLLHHGVAMTDDVDVDPNALAHMPGMEELHQAIKLIKIAQDWAPLSGLANPHFREERRRLNRASVVVCCILQLFLNDLLFSVYKDVPVLESKVETSTKTSILFFQALHVNYMSSFRTQNMSELSGWDQIVETLRAYFDELTRIEVWKTFKQTARD